MALVNLTNVNPWQQENEAAARANEQNQRTWAQLQNTLDKASERRYRAREKNRELRDKEYALAADATDKLVQANTNNKFTDIQLQQLGQGFKQEYYNAVKQYEASDKSDEARQAFEEAKQRSLGSARVISKSLDNLGAQMETFKQAAKTSGISDATDPAIREFFTDLQDPDTPMDQYQIVPDEQTGQLRYVGKTSGGRDVDFLLDDIANGENGFAPIPEADMPKIITGLTEDLSKIRTKIKEDWGVREVTDWKAMGEALDSRFDNYLSDTTNFRSVAAGLGFDYDAFKAAEAGETITVEAIDDEVHEISSLDDLKAAVKKELFDQVEATTPHTEKILYDTRPGEVAEVKAKQAEEISAQTSAQFEEAIATKDPSAFNGYLGKQVVLNGLKGNVYGVDVKGNKAKLTIRAGKEGEERDFDLKNINDLALFQSIMTGQDYNLIKQATINSLKE